MINTHDSVENKHDGVYAIRSLDLFKQKKMSDTKQLNEMIPEGCEPPSGYPLSNYGPLLFDGGSSSKVYAWGYRILHQLGEERFNSLSRYGKLICLSMGNWWGVTNLVKTRRILEMNSSQFLYKLSSKIREKMAGINQSIPTHFFRVCHTPGNWALVVKWLTPEEAIEKFGPITHQVFGPSGGWRSVTYGTTQFSAKELKPSPELESKFDYKKEILPKKGTLDADNSHVFSGLKKIRKENRYSIEKFAVLLGVPKETIVHWENRK